MWPQDKKFYFYWKNQFWIKLQQKNQKLKTTCSPHPVASPLNYKPFHKNWKLCFFSSGYKASGTHRMSARFLRFFDMITNDLKVFQPTRRISSGTNVQHNILNFCLLVRKGWEFIALGTFEGGQRQWRILELKKSFTFSTEHEISITYLLPKLK